MSRKNTRVCFRLYFTHGNILVRNWVLYELKNYLLDRAVLGSTGSPTISGYKNYAKHPNVIGVCFEWRGKTITKYSTKKAIMRKVFTHLITNKGVIRKGFPSIFNYVRLE